VARRHVPARLVTYQGGRAACVCGCCRRRGESLPLMHIGRFSSGSASAVRELTLALAPAAKRPACLLCDERDRSLEPDVVDSEQESRLRPSPEAGRDRRGAEPARYLRSPAWRLPARRCRDAVRMRAEKCARPRLGPSRSGSWRKHSSVDANPLVALVAEAQVCSLAAGDTKAVVARAQADDRD
jgi:hypothetical protein